MNPRNLIITAAALAVAALAGPSSALAGSSHLLKTYKVEKHLDIQGEDGSYVIKCKGANDNGRTDAALFGAPIRVRAYRVTADDQSAASWS